MRHFISLVFISGIILTGLINCSDEKKTDNESLLINNSTSIHNTTPECPEGHTDSIIQILYGFPDERSFERADSGLIILGGCELADENWYCKKHKISFP
ncbi:MAG: hypothetical protein IPM77_10810 [Crocinitomicaceae bacterium]|nr:hypothetical protein [Crocinitomicaceae bacterium]